MLAGVSHDLRTPLTRLKLTLAMLPDNDSLRHDVSDMTADVVEMERMIEGYLAFARGERAEQAEPTDLIVLLGDIVTQTNRSGAAVDLRAPETLVLRLRADAIRRAVGNLVDNACRHAKTVRVSVEQTERAVIVAVDDNGPGIPADRRENVFRPFESGSHGGTGLGLTIARDIARAHGGDITLSDSPLGGLSARLRLPR
jgi:two-component system osmolarity sensor histidine kinase EnvZ